MNDPSEAMTRARELFEKSGLTLDDLGRGAGSRLIGRNKG
jgi:hypothetical protein